MSDKRVDVVLSDVHGLFRDKRAIDAALRVAERVECNRIVLNGDIVDFPTISKYDIDPARLHAWSMKREAKSIAPFLMTVDEMSPEPVVYLAGNHERRHSTYLKHNAPHAHEFYGKSLREVLPIPERWDLRRYMDFLNIGRLQITHGANPLKSDAGASALGHQRKFGGHILIGHTHRLAHVTFTNRAGVWSAFENGHLSQPPHYAEATQNWAQGFSVVTSEGARFGVELVPVQSGKAFYRGEWI